MLNPDIIVKLISSLKFGTENFINHRVQSREGAKGLVVSHGNILVQLYKEDEQTMTSISSKIGRCKSTLTVLVDKLEKAGFIARKVDSEDTRVKKLCLTEKGKEFQTTFWEISTELNSTLWQGFSEEEQQEFLGYLMRMNKNIDSISESRSKFEEFKKLGAM